MSNIVEQICDAFESSISTQLGVTYKELKYKFDVAENNFKINKKRYGVIPSSGETFSGITCNYTMSQDFEVILTDDFVNRLGDSGQRSAMFGLYDQMDKIFKELYTQKAGIPNIIILVESMTLEEPEFLEDNIVVLRSIFTVQYRQPLN